ncbi:lipopolysaccharide biosynthesis protein [Candidatus Protofrankia datiscae]|uniref:lipopolysaccharide biosynthesis protein n=1 Tax=Candidatus Protofrankia datiscae TaxID=2716812 RepID=UPI00067FBD83|nr:hypothetical protein [Candidatus Protofrankia datiscae]
MTDILAAHGVLSASGVATGRGTASTAAAGRPRADSAATGRAATDGGSTDTGTARGGTAGRAGRPRGAAARWAPARRATATAVRAASPIAAAGIIVNTANLLVTLVLARALPPVAYGALAQLLALFFVVSMPGSALLVGVVRTITSWRQDGRGALVDGWVARVRRAGVVLTLSAAAGGLALRGAIAAALSLPGPGGVAEMLTAGAAWCLLCVDRGLLQSALRHRTLAVNLALEGLTRGVLAVVLVLAGLGPAGASLATLLGVLVGLAHSRRALGSRTGRRRGGRPRAGPPGTGLPRSETSRSGRAAGGRPRAGHRRAGAGPRPVDPRPARRQPGSRRAADPPPRPRPGGPGAARAVPAMRTAPTTRARPAEPASPAMPTSPVGATGPAVPTNRPTVEIGAALTALVLLGLLQNIDLLVLGAHRSADAGPYAAVSVACKALVFAAVALGGFLLPETATRRHRGEHALHQLGGTLAMLAVPAAALVAVALVAPRAGLTLAFGAPLAARAPAFAPLAGAMACLGATVLCTYYLLAVGERRVLAVLAAASALAVPALWWARGDAIATARIELVVHAALLTVAGSLVRIAARRGAPPGPTAGRRVAAPIQPGRPGGGLHRGRHNMWRSTPSAAPRHRRRDL